MSQRGKVLRRPRIEEVTVDHTSLELTGQVTTSFAPSDLKVVLRRFRNENQAWSRTPECVPAPRNLAMRLLGLTPYHFKVRFDLSWNDVAPGLFALEMQVLDGSQRIQFHASPTAPGIYPAGDRTLCIFTEPSVKIVRIETHAIGPEALATLTQAAKKADSSVLSCVIGEYTNTARDNGIALFREIGAHGSDINATYVVEANNLDGLPVGRDGVVAWGSEAHLRSCLDSDICAFTHDRSYVYPAILKVIAPDRYANAKTLFLQHGVMAMKGGSVVAHYHCDRVNYDGVIVSSQREKAIFTDHFGYPPDRVHVTGLPRLDRLYRKAREVSPAADRVLVAPTWRSGLEKLSSKEISNHPYFVNWRAAMAALRAKGLDPVLIGHQILRQHLSLMGAEPDEIHDNTMFQDTLLSASALVTDYSSTAWDALYVSRPVFLFHFDDDQDGFIPSSELPGPISNDAETLATTVASAHDANWPFKAQTARDLAFGQIDDGNTDRVTALIRRMAKAGPT